MATRDEFFAAWDQLSQEEKAARAERLAPEAKQWVMERAQQRQQERRRAEVKASMPGYQMSGAELGARGVIAGVEDAAIGSAQLLGKILPGSAGDELSRKALLAEDIKRAERAGILTGREDLGIPSPTEAYTTDLPGPLDYNPIGFGRGSAAALPSILMGGAAGRVLGAAGKIPAVGRAGAALAGFKNTYPITASVGRGAAAIAGGAASGAMGGASIPLTTAEDEAGVREGNAKVGALFGAAAPAALGGLTLTRNALQLASRQTPDEATQALARALGYNPAIDRLDDQLAFRSGVEGAYQDARKMSKALYDLAENRPNLPDVSIPASSKRELWESLNNLHGDLGLGSSPRMQRVFKALRHPSNTVSSFGELRELQREIRSISRGLPPDSPARGAARRAQEILDDAFNQWESTDFNTRGALIAAKRADEHYADAVKPFEEGRLGDLRGGAERRAADQAYANPDSAFSYYSPDAENVLTSAKGAPLAREVIARVPATAQPLQRLWARNLANEGRTAASRADMLSGAGPLRTLGVTDKDVLTQADRIATAYRGADESPVLAALAKKIPLAERLMSGVPRMGQTGALSDMDINSAMLASWLLGGPTQAASDRDMMY